MILGLETFDSDYESLLEAISDGIYISDLQGNFITVNSAVVKTYGYPKEYFVGKSPVDFSAPGMNDLGDLKACFQKCVSENLPQKMEFWAVCADGSIFPKEVVINPGLFRGEKVMIAVAREISERKKIEDDLREKAERDHLTGLYNRGLFEELLGKNIASWKRNKSPFTLLILDVDNFKKINDTYGHPVGDQMLMLLAKQALISTREEDVLARIGGDEFAVILPKTSLDESKVLAERIRFEISALSLNTKSGPISFTISIGASQVGGNAKTTKKIIKKSDEALLNAKRDGKNCVKYNRCISEEINKMDKSRQEYHLGCP